MPSVSDGIQLRDFSEVLGTLGVLLGKWQMDSRNLEAITGGTSRMWCG